MVHIGNRWDELLAGEFASDYYQQLRVFLKKEYSTRRIYPHMNDIFNALRYTDYDDVRAVILGQDPYHGPGQAHGLCFSVQDGVPKPPSLVNIFKELQDDVGFQPPESGNLTRWAQNVWSIAHKGSDEETAAAGIDALAAFIKEIGLPTSFAELGIPADTDFRAITDSTNVTAGCCKKLTRDEICEILQECL